MEQAWIPTTKNPNSNKGNVKISMIFKKKLGVILPEKNAGSTRKKRVTSVVWVSHGRRVHLGGYI